MKTKTLFALWGGMFILCAALGFIPAPGTILRILMTGMGIGFFLCPALLLLRASGSGDRNTLALIRNLAALSLGLTLVLLVANMAAFMAPEAVGNVLHGVLVMVSAPMFCFDKWVISLFFWGCILFASLSMLRRKR